MWQDFFKEVGVLLPMTILQLTFKHGVARSRVWRRVWQSSPNAHW